MLYKHFKNTSIIIALIGAFLFVAPISVTAQYKVKKNSYYKAKKNLFKPKPRKRSHQTNKLTFGAGIGALSYYGDLGADRGLKAKTIYNTGYNFFLERTFGNTLCATGKVTVGKLTGQDYKSNNRNLNFQTKLFQADISLTFYLQEVLNFDKRSPFMPVVSIGVGYFTFDPWGDLKDSNGKTYYSWKDGTIRDKPYDKHDPQNGIILIRDYKYETKLDSANSYKHNAISFPIGAGLCYKFMDRIIAKIGLTYYITTTDDIDDKNNPGTMRTGEKNNWFKDSFMFSSLSVLYILSEKSSKYTFSHRSKF